MPIKIYIDPNKIGAKVDEAWKKGLPTLSEQILADCNLYCKEDKTTLIDSSLIHSRPKEGKLVWQTPYARRQYWAIQTAVKDVNPNASWKWCEVAKLHKWREWKQLAQDLMKQNL